MSGGCGKRRTLSWELTSAPCSMRRRATSRLPFWAHEWSGVQPRCGGEKGRGGPGRASEHGPLARRGRGGYARAGGVRGGARLVDGSHVGAVLEEELDEVPAARVSGDVQGCPTDLPAQKRGVSANETVAAATPVVRPEQHPTPLSHAVRVSLA